MCSIYLDNNFYNPEKVVDIENYPDFQVAHVPENILALPGSSKLEVIQLIQISEWCIIQPLDWAVQISKDLAR